MTESTAEPPMDEGPAPPHLTRDTCMDLVTGLLPEPARGAALDHLRACPTCEARFRHVGADYEGVRARPAPAGWRRDTAPEEAPTPVHLTPRPARSYLRIALPLALAAALFLVARAWWPRPAPPRAGAEGYWIPITGELQQLRAPGGEESDSTFWNGLAAYQAHDTARARALLEAARTPGGYDDLRRLYLASVLLNAGQATEALALLDVLRIETLPMPWREDATWMKYRALAALRRDTEADALLRRMAAWPGRVGDLARGVAHPPPR